MNGLSLRITRAGTNKSKKSICFTPVGISDWDRISSSSGENNNLFKKFVQSPSADDQLKILKEILDSTKCGLQSDTIIFLVIVFMEAEVKHPVKSFLTRHVTKTSYLQAPFTDALAAHITTLLHKHADYTQYIPAVSRMSTCIENFPAGTAAVMMVDSALMEYLLCCLECCVTTLRDSTTMSPTEKNEVFTLAHLALRLLLFIVQKATIQSKNLTLMFEDIRLYVQHLMFDVDVPMDTKSVCGILYVTMHVYQYGPDRWIDILLPRQEGKLSELLCNEAAQLALYSAIATVVCMDRLQAQTIGDESAAMVLTTNILHIGDRSSSESIFILGVSRTLLQISKSLDKIVDHNLGVSLVDSLLMYIWSHLEHYMDSVRHLTAQALGCIVRYCIRLRNEGNDKALAKLFSALNLLDKSRKSYYVSVTSLASQLGARSLLAALPDVIGDVMGALRLQPVQASATTALEVLLQKHSEEADTQTIYEQWVQPILSYVTDNTLHSGVLNILENILAKAVKLDDHLMAYIIPHIQSSATSKQDLKCILMLLSVARKANVTGRKGDGALADEGLWKGLIDYHVLGAAAVDAVEETRILSLCLVVESPKSTEPFTARDLSFVLRYLTYNINAQAPNFRQLTLSFMKKFIKRLEDSYKVLKRQNKPEDTTYKVDYYLRFVEDLRQLLFDSLIRGANYSRRFVALQILVWCEQMQLDGYHRTWKADYVDTLLYHLDDSYENNKAFALAILYTCPDEFIKGKKFCMGMEIEDILKQASSLKPTDCVSAAYKLCFVLKKLPESTLTGEEGAVCEAGRWAALRLLCAAARAQAELVTLGGLQLVRRGPMYGPLHCLHHLLQSVNARAISGDPQWNELIEDIIDTCFKVNSVVACVVNNSSPEGHLPMDMTGVVVNDDGTDGGVRLDDGPQVTAQMVLLCAWRSVKEVSLLLGTMCSRLTISGEGQETGTLSPRQLCAVGEHFTSLLAETKHRGAFEQAYVGFTCLLTRLWRCRSAELHSLPLGWLRELMEAIATGDTRGSLCATRRSAGLPFMIQALVTTELQVSGCARSFPRCMGALLRLARAGARAEQTRVHCLNILRALFRNAALDEAVSPYVGEGLTVALQGFEGNGWAERNSSTLVFSALMVRTFGVTRSRGDILCVRNRMTGRIFFLRYPHLYDFMLDKLKQVSDSDDTQVLRPSLYPILMLLARLYPSSLEGTVSNLKLVAFIPHVLSCARSGVLTTRRLAARAVLPLIAPDQYIPHIQSMLALIQPSTKRNYIHGILLQLSRLLQSVPEEIQHTQVVQLEGALRCTMWLLEQGHNTCYLVLDEYVQVLNLVVWRFPYLLHQDMKTHITTHLERLIFKDTNYKISPGRDVCLANALYLHLIVLHKYYNDTHIPPVVLNSLAHTSYEVVVSVLNYLLIQHNSLEADNTFLEHLQQIRSNELLKLLKNNKHYIEGLCNVLNNKYLECQQKCLRILVLEKDTQVYITKVHKDEDILYELFNLINKAHENLTHIYLESLSDFVGKKLKESSLCSTMLLDVLRTIFACSSSDNSHSTRSVVVGFLEDNVDVLLNMNMDGLSEEEKFEYKSTLWSTAITVLEDDDEDLRQRMSNKLVSLIQCAGSKDQPFDSAVHVGALGNVGPIIPCLCAEMVRDYIGRDNDCVALYILLALLDFRSEVCITDEVGEECRVFDQNERYNIFLEESIWSDKCANKIIEIHKRDKIQDKVIDYVTCLITKPVYERTFDKLCNNNVLVFKAMVNCGKVKSDLDNPKIEVFVNRLCSE